VPFSDESRRERYIHIRHQRWQRPVKGKHTKDVAKGKTKREEVKSREGSVRGEKGRVYPPKKQGAGRPRPKSRTMPKVKY
jgi:hypothetical protein